MQMTCPKCHGEMRVYERSGVTVDQCTECRGIFLDRGELEKLFEAEANWQGPAASPAGRPVPPAPPAPPPGAYAPPLHGGGYPPQPAYGQPVGYPPAAGYHGHYRQVGHHGHYHRGRRHKGFLSDFFD